MRLESNFATEPPTWWWSHQAKNRAGMHIGRAGVLVADSRAEEFQVAAGRQDRDINTAIAMAQEV
jgi:hypothetical protein